VVVGDRGDDQLVGPGGVAQLFELVGDLAGTADELGVGAVGDQGAVGVRPLVAASLLAPAAELGRGGHCDGGPDGGARLWPSDRQPRTFRMLMFSFLSAGRRKEACRNDV
jgi:hypothetical protein